MSTGPQFRIESVDVGPEELTASVPRTLRMLRVIPGPDRPDYCLGVLDEPLQHRTSLHLLQEAGIDPARADPRMIAIEPNGTVRLQVFAVVLCARIVGQQICPGMVDVPVNLAYVLDNTLLRDDALDFSKALFAAVVLVSDVPEQAAPTA